MVGAEGEEDSQFFNMASKAMKRLTSREERAQEAAPKATAAAGAAKPFKEPSTKTVPLQMLVREILFHDLD